MSHQRGACHDRSGALFAAGATPYPPSADAVPPLIGIYFLGRKSASRMGDVEPRRRSVVRGRIQPGLAGAEQEQRARERQDSCWKIAMHAKGSLWGRP